jgi:deoxycytidylate deaminase
VKKRNRFLKAAKQLADKTKDMRRGFGCVIVDGNKILASGRNFKSHPRIPKIVGQNGEMYYGLHCECKALLDCDFSVRGATIYIHGENVSTQTPVYSGPCMLCDTILRERGIKKAIFTTSTGIEEKIYA